jgi:hypothetical protein
MARGIMFTPVGQGFLSEIFLQQLFACPNIFKNKIQKAKIFQ